MPTSVYFEDKLKKLLDPDWQHEEIKVRYSAFGLEKNNNSVACQIDSQEKLMTEIDKDSDKVLSKILDMRKTYIEYLDQMNKIDNQRDKIWTYALELKQDLHINNKEKK